MPRDHDRRLEAVPAGSGSRPVGKVCDEDGKDERERDYAGGGKHGGGTFVVRAARVNPNF